MLFNSAIFLVFFLVVYALYWLSPHKLRLWLILASGCVFYGSWDWRFLLLLFFTSGMDFLAAKKIADVFVENSQNKKKALPWLLASIIINLVTLGFFKYFNFFAETFTGLLSVFGLKPGFAAIQIILPVGISFYTFQSIAYVTDVYRGIVKAEKLAVHYFSFICFFPQMVAGPIERAKRMLPQFHTNKKWSWYYFENGINLLLYGFFKKVVIADNLAIISDGIHNNLQAQSQFALWSGVFVFAIQIYADFSGYTDIARGSARLMGFRLSCNFYFPYFASSFKQFWKRWHISLSSWFRDYVYLPLGGSRVRPFRRNINLLLTFVISGLWHGANYTFLAWGFFHGLALIAEKSFRKISKPLWVCNVLVFLIVSYLFTLFRSPTTEHFLKYSISLFSQHNPEQESVSNFPESGYFFVIPFLVFAFMELRLYCRNSLLAPRFNYVYNALLFLLIVLFSVFENAPQFIYFQF